MDLKLECRKRTADEKPKALRRSGVLPAVLYGHNGAESMDLKVDTHTAEALLRQAVVNKSVITVSVPEASWNGKVILREVQTHPWKNQIFHLSFFSIAGQDEIEVTMPLQFSGDAPGVVTGGGTLDTVMTEVQLKCPPDRIPQTLEVDVSGLEIGDGLTLGQIVLPAAVTAVGEPEQIVVSVLPPRQAEPETPVEASAEVPVIGEESAAPEAPEAPAAE